MWPILSLHEPGALAETSSLTVGRTRLTTWRRRRSGRPGDRGEGRQGEPAGHGPAERGRVSDPTRVIYQALRAGIWIPGQRQRLRQLAPGTWNQALAGVLGASPGRPGDGPGHPVVEIAIYPDVVWLAARSLPARDTSHRQAS